MSYGVGLRNGVAFALGTIPSLTSGGGLRPSLMLDFLSGSLDPRITFSRGTQAMQYGSDGTLQYAPNNLLTYSNQADNAAWTKSNSFVQTNLITQSVLVGAVSGTPGTAPTGWTITVGTGSTIAQTSSIIQSATTGNRQFLTSTSVVLAASTTYTASVNINAVSGLSTENIFAINPSVGSIASGTIVITIADGIGRKSITFTTGASGATIEFRIGAGVSNIVNSNVSVDFSQPQLVQGSVPGDYVATTSAALPVLYADYNGALRARKLCEDSATAAHNFNQSAGVIGNTETFSFYAKAGERTWAIAQLGSSLVAYFDLTNGVLGNLSGGATATITLVNNGYYRCTLTGTRSTNTSSFIYCTTGNGVPSYAGNGSSGIYIADAQLTPGYLPLAVTETTSAAVYGPRFDYDPSSLVTQNLFTYSEQFDNAAWAKSNSSVTANQIAAPDGTLTADKLFDSTSNTNHFVAESPSLSIGTHTVSVYAKSSELRRLMIRENSFLGGAGIFDLISGTVVASISGATASIASMGNGWYRCSVLNPNLPGGTTQFGIYVMPDTATVVADAVYIGTGTNGIYLWGAQLNRGSTALPYTATTTAPYTLTTARGLLIEEQRANLLLQSNDFQTSWTPTNITRTLNSTLSPEGVVNGVKLEATASTTSTLYQNTAVASTAATFSVYVKQGTGATTANGFVLRNFTTATNLLNGTLNYSTGVWTYSVGSSGVVIRNIGNGWWRVEMSATAGITSGDLIGGYVGFSGGVYTAGDFLYAYGAQLEAGAFATSYIPTLGSTATRNADSASITTLTPWFNAAAGTLYAAGSNFVPDADSTVRILAALTDTISLTNAVRLERVTNLWRDVQTVAGVASVASGTWTFGTNGKIVGAYQSSNSAATFNGATPTAVGTATMPSGITALGIGCNTSTGNSWNGWISSVRYYPTRLANASLQSITA